MITEDYVSFETAKLLKEKGFDIPLNYFYNSDGRKCYATSYNWNQTTGDFQDYSCPTLQMAMKWLREKHNLSISVFLLNVVDGEYIGYHADIELMAEWIENLNKFKKVSLSKTFHSYEQACESAVKYCLENLI